MIQVTHVRTEKQQQQKYEIVTGLVHTINYGLTVASSYVGMT